MLNNNNHNRNTNDVNNITYLGRLINFTCVKYLANLTNFTCVIILN